MIAAGGSTDLAEVQAARHATARRSAGEDHCPKCGA
jgi:hypothetical protein